MTSPRRFLVGLILLLSPGVSRALDWQQTSVEIRADPFQSTVQICFPFANTGKQSAQILDIQTNCDCITATTDKREYAPGEFGQLSATFYVGDRYGFHEQSLQVVTDDAAAPQKLKLIIEVPEPAIISPRTVEWIRDETLIEKSLDLTPEETLNITFTEATATNDSFSVRLETAKDGSISRVFVRPNSTSAPANAAIRISGHDKNAHNFVISAYANVR